MRPIRYSLLLLSFLFMVVACGPTRAVDVSPTVVRPTSTFPPTRTVLAPTVNISTSALQSTLLPTTDRLPPTAVAMLPQADGSMGGGQPAPSLPNVGPVNQSAALVRIAIFSPVPGSTLAGDVPVEGAAMHPQFAYYQLEYAPDPNPGNIWQPASGIVGAPLLNGTLGVWSTGELPDGLYQLRLTVGLRDAPALSTVVNNLRVQNRVSAPIPSVTPAIPAPVAAFVATPTTGTAPLTVQFSNQSVGEGLQIAWNFGDGGTVQNITNPVHTYNTPGVYMVTLTVSNNGGSSSVSRQITVRASIATTFPTPLPTATPNPTPQQLIVQIVDAADDVNEQSFEYQVNDAKIWIGNAGTQDRSSYTGLRFQKVLIPKGATILSAHLELYEPDQQWIEIHFSMSAEAADNSLPFTSSNKPSGRQLTATQIEHESNENWSAGEWHSLDDMRLVLQEVVNRPGWERGNSLSVILQGFGGGSWGRKFVSSYDGDPSHAPRLVITYQGT